MRLSVGGVAYWLGGLFGWRIFLYLWLTCDRFVGKVSAKGQPTRPTQPSGVGKWVVTITWITGVDTTKRQTRTAYGCLVASQSPLARPQCLTWTAPLQLWYAAFGAVEVLYAFAFVIVSFPRCACVCSQSNNPLKRHVKQKKPGALKHLKAKTPRLDDSVWLTVRLFFVWNKFETEDAAVRGIGGGRGIRS